MANVLPYHPSAYMLPNPPRYIHVMNNMTVGRPPFRVMTIPFQYRANNSVGPFPRAIVTWKPVPQDPELYRPNVDRRHQQFPRFPDLPVELRVMIWKYAAPARVIEIRSWGNSNTNPSAPIKYSISKHHFPSILHVCFESRSEGLKIYQKINIGVSTNVLDPSREYVSWANHPNNPHAPYESRVAYSNHYNPVLALPCPVQQLYVDYSRDVIYLGPEFQTRHLQRFLTATGPGKELADVKHLALDRKLFVNGAIQYRGRGFEYLRKSLHSLSFRPLKTLYIVPDDEVNSLDDKWYYRKHEISLVTPPWRYCFRLENGPERVATLEENLMEWMVRVWGDNCTVPELRYASLRRNGKEIGNFKHGVWELQRLLGDLMSWKTWVPSVVK